MSIRSLPRQFGLALALGVAVLWGAHDSIAQTYQSNVAQLSQDEQQAVNTGVELERNRRWLDAIDHYDETLKAYPNNKYLEYGLRRAKTHFSIERRYTDRSFLAELSALPEASALSFFDDILTKVKDHYVEPISATSFVAHGTESLYLALVNDRFAERNLPNADVESVREFRRTLREQFWNKPVADAYEARQTVRHVADMAQRSLGLSSASVIMEYVFGGCNSLDDYSSFLTSSRLGDLYSNIEGEFVGIGIEMKAVSGRGLLLVDVLPESPADEGGALPGDHIVMIDGVDCRSMTTDEAASLLQGRSGSRVSLVLADAESKQRPTTLVRRAVKVKSFPVAMIIDRNEGVGYLRMTGFQKNSAEELDIALRDLQSQGMRALIWDVRGNPGGLLTAAVEVLDRFIDRGVLVSTKGRTSDQNWTYSAQGTTTTNVPLVLLIDEDSASASEIVAGAVRDHRRGVLVGRKTFGKWSVQSILPSLNSTGLRLTTAKFYSPSGRTHGKVGVYPDVEVKISGTAKPPRDNRSDVAGDEDIMKGLEVLRRQLARR